MNKTIDIHNHKKIVARIMERINEGREFSKENKASALGFRDELLSQNIGLAKTGRYLQDAIWFNKQLAGKNFKKVTKNNIKKVIGDMNQSTLSENTKKGIKIFLRKFYKFIRNVEGKGKYPKEVDWFTVTISNSSEKIPDELLTEEEMFKIVKAAKNDRDRALMIVLCESGCRVGEIGSMQINHIAFEEYGARITVNGKTGMRKILVIKSAPYLQTWLNSHPLKDSINAPLWVNYQNKILGYPSIRGILKDCAEKAKINKRVYPHLLRHSRATIMAKGISEATMKQYLGWTQSSKMAGVYIHLSGKDTDDAILAANGIEIEKEEIKSPLKPKKCARCSSINGATNKFCSFCSLPLSQEVANEVIQKDLERKRADEIMNKLLMNPKILEIIGDEIG
jgi:site-specific recombinase XerD